MGAEYTPLKQGSTQMVKYHDRSVSVERTIAASAERVFAALADPTVHAVIDGSGTLRPMTAGAADPLSSGATFITPMGRRVRGCTRADMVQAAVAVLVQGQMRNTVVEFDYGRRIAWRNFGRHIWRFELTPVTGCRSATHVRETFDYSTNLAPWLLEWARFPSRNACAMTDTLQALDRLLATESEIVD